MADKTRVASYIIDIYMPDDAEVPAVNDALDELALGDKMRKQATQLMWQFGGALAGCTCANRHDR
jgi:hypothetical protein